MTAPGRNNPTAATTTTIPSTRRRPPPPAPSQDMMFTRQTMQRGRALRSSHFPSWQSLDSHVEGQRLEHSADDHLLPPLVPHRENQIRMYGASSSAVLSRCAKDCGKNGCLRPKNRLSDRDSGCGLASPRLQAVDRNRRHWSPAVAMPQRSETLVRFRNVIIRTHQQGGRDAGRGSCSHCERPARWRQWRRHIQHVRLSGCP